MDRYKLVVWHGELETLFYIVDSHVQEGEQPAIIETHRDKRQALANLEHYNRVERGAV